MWVNVLDIRIEDEGGAQTDETETVDRATTHSVGKDPPEKGCWKGDDFIVQRQGTCDVARVLRDTKDDGEGKWLNDIQVGDQTDCCEAGNEI